MRFAEPHAIIDRVAWTARKAQLDLLRRKQAAQPVSVPGEPDTMLDEFLKLPPLKPDGNEFFCEDLESWVMEQLGI